MVLNITTPIMADHKIKFYTFRMLFDSPKPILVNIVAHFV